MVVGTGEDRNTIRVLHVDDGPGFAEMAGTFLEREDDRLVVEIATSAEGGLDAISDRLPDCVVSDYDMPGKSGVEFLRTVREKHPSLPFILFTGKGSETVASEAISAGVTDYLQKRSSAEQYELLANRITNAVEARRATQKAAQQEELMRLTEYDGNTGGWELDLETEKLQLTDGAQRVVDVPSGEYLTLEDTLTLFDPDDRQSIQTALDRAAETNEQVQGTYRVDTHSGERRIIRMTITPVSSGGDVTALRGAFNDITKEKTREHQLAELNKTTQHLSRVSSREQVAEIGVQAARDILNLRANAVHFATADNTELVPVAQTDESRSLIGEAPTLPVEDSIAGRVYQTGEPEVIADVRQDQDVYNPHTELQSHWYLPLGDHGILLAGSEEPTAFNESDHTGAQLLAGNIVAALDRIERAERADEYQKKLSLFFEESPLGAVQWDESFHFDRLNRQAEEILGYDETDLRGESWEQIVSDSDRDLVGNVVEELLEADGGTYVTNKNITQSGEVRICEWHNRAVSDSDGEVQSIFSQFRDITDRRRRKKQLEEFETILKTLTDAVYVLDEDGRFTYVNDAFVKLVGYERETIIGNTPSLIKDQESVEIAEQQLRRLLSEDGPEVVTFEVTVQIQGGDPIVCEDQMRVLPYDSESFTGSVGALRDISEYKKRAKELKRQNDRLDEFASVVSHDLRNPLNVAQGRLELAQDECDSNHHDDIAQAHDRMESLIEDLLTLARTGDRVGDIEPIDLANLSVSCWENVVTAQASLTTDIDRRVKADRSRLQQLIENLVRNAVDHGGSDVTVTVGELDTGFYIEDDGPGIPAAERDAVFDPGHSTDQDGTGFGLSIVRQVVQSHGWDIRVTDGANGGARFEITGVSFASGSPERM